MADFGQLVDICRNHKVFIQTHNFPDPDAISSAFALHELMGKLGVETRICCDGQIDRVSTAKLSEMTGVKIYQADELSDIMNSEDYIICVDSQKWAGNITDFIGDEIACIDHHPTFKEIEYKFKQVEMVGACATLMTEHFRAMEIQPSKLAATALLYGIKMDTMHFTRGVTERDIEAFYYLFPLVDRDALHRLETNNLVYDDLKAYGTAIRNIHFYNSVAFSKIPFACPDGLIASLSDFMLSVEEVDVVIIYAIRQNGIKLSVRSMLPEVNSGVLTSETLKGIGNGGGHAFMAGGFIPMENVPSIEDGKLEAFIETLFLEKMAVIIK